MDTISPSYFPLSLLPIIPFLGAFLNFILGKKLRKGTVSLIGCGVIAIAALIATQAVCMLIWHHEPVLKERLFSADWLFSQGDEIPGLRRDLHIGASFLLDRLSAILVLIITWISLLIHIYSIGYMKDDPKYARFFAYLNLFTGSMLILVLGDSLPVTFVGWEGVGLCSYLLIGFWYQEEKNASAGKKAFIVNRIGDFGFLLGMCLLFSLVGKLDYQSLTPQLVWTKLQQPLWFGWPAHYFIALFLFIGCMGKSAQIPLYVWLPDAMAGPTPVSALIHAATMVTAGVYVVARTHSLYDGIPNTARMLVAGIGAITALFAATIGLVQKDFKKVLAYSTVSQLGFMFVGVGTGAYAAGIFHLLTHAFFKAGLFLGAGSVMHALQGEGDITKMGGLRKHLPITHATFFIYCLAIAGIFPFAGFFSKDAILLGAWESTFRIAQTASPGIQLFVTKVYPKLLWGMLLIAALCTAIYMWRLYFLVFTGTFRGSKEQEAHLHESPKTMTIPLIVLALGSIFIGFLGIPEVLLPKNIHLAEILPKFLGVTSPHNPIEHKTSLNLHTVELLLMGTALLVSLLGINIAYILYPRGFSKMVSRLAARFKTIHQVLFRGYYINELYHILFVRPLTAFAQFCSKILDGIFIDKVLVQSWASITQGLGRAVRYIQNGDVQRYLIALLFGAMGLLYLILWNPLHELELRMSVDFTLKQPDPQRMDYVELESGNSSLKTNPGEKLFYFVSWGDGRQDKFFGHPIQAKINHSYKRAGIYHITVTSCEKVFSPEQKCIKSDQLLFHRTQTIIIPAKTTDPKEHV